MAMYDFRCAEHGVFEVKRPMSEAGSHAYCPTCGVEAQRLYAAAPQLWACDGAHRTDYDKQGDKLERLNREWSAITGEAPPPKSREVPRNSLEKH